MNKRMDFWEWLNTCPVDYQLDNDDGIDISFTFFFGDKDDEWDSSEVDYSKRKMSEV